MTSNLTPAVQKVVDSVRHLVREGTLRAGAPLPAENDLAETLGASRNTVRRAIVVLEQTGVVERRPYARPVVRGVRVPADRTGRHDVRVWVCHTIGDYGTLAFLRGLSKALARTPYRVSVSEPSGRDVAAFAEERRFLVDALHSGGTAAVIMVRDAYADNRDVLEELVSAGIPLVLVDGGVPRGLQADFVGTGNTLAAQRAVETLIEMGHHHIAFLADDLVPAANAERLRGYRRAMLQVGLSPTVLEAKKLPSDESRSRPAAGPFADGLDRRSYFGSHASRLTGAFLLLDPLPTAIFAACDGLAFNLCAYLQGEGIDLPERISVVGFDGLDRFGVVPGDFLTTCVQDFEGFGVNAASLLLDRLESETVLEPRHVLLDAPLALRTSISPYRNSP